MDVSNNRIFVRLGFTVFNSDNTIPFFRCAGMARLEAKSMEKYFVITEENDSANIEVDWSFYKSIVLQSAKAIEKKMKKQRVGTPFINCSFEKAFDNEMIIRRIQLVSV